MPKIPLYRLLAIACLLVVSLSSGFAQTPQGTTIDGLRVAVSYDKSTVQAGQPLVMSITLENVSAEPILDFTASLLFPEGNGINLQIQPPGELAYRYAGGVDPGTYPATPFQLVSGRPLTLQQLILFDATQDSGYAFPKPGRYELYPEIIFSMRKKPEIRSVSFPPTTIEVTETTGIDAEVKKAIDPALVRAMHLGVAPTTGILNGLQSLADKYSRTTMGALALRAAGMHYVYREPATRDKGARMLTTYLENGAVAGDVDYVALAIAGAYHLDGKYDLARAWTFYVFRNCPESVRIRPEDALFNFYIYAPADFASRVPWFLLKRPYVVPNAKPPADLKPLKEAN